MAAVSCHNTPSGTFWTVLCASHAHLAGRARLVQCLGHSLAAHALKNRIGHLMTQQ